MLGKRHNTHARARGAAAIVATAAALGGVASFAAPGLASDTIKVGVGETSIVVNGTTISTSNLTIAQLAKLQGVPASTVQLELDGVAANTPAASAVEALIASLPVEATLATALEDISKATGGAISPQTALRQVIEDEGTPEQPESKAPADPTAATGLAERPAPTASGGGRWRGRCRLGTGQQAPQPACRPRARSRGTQARRCACRSPCPRRPSSATAGASSPKARARSSRAQTC